MPRKRVVRKPELTPQEFIFRASVEPSFRKKYFRNPDLLGEEYQITHVDLQSIKGIDFAQLTKELDAFTSLEMVKVGLGFEASHTKNSHTSHTDGGHSNSSHSNGADDVMRSVLDRVLTDDVMQLRDKFRR
jgi:hypothetical protein